MNNKKTQAVSSAEVRETSSPKARIIRNGVNSVFIKQEINRPLDYKTEYRVYFTDGEKTKFYDVMPERVNDNPVEMAFEIGRREQVFVTRDWTAFKMETLGRFISTIDQKVVLYEMPVPVATFDSVKEFYRSSLCVSKKDSDRYYNGTMSFFKDPLGEVKYHLAQDVNSFLFKAEGYRVRGYDEAGDKVNEVVWVTRVNDNPITLAEEKIGSKICCKEVVLLDFIPNEKNYWEEWHIVSDKPWKTVSSDEISLLKEIESVSIDETDDFLLDMSEIDMSAIDKSMFDMGLFEEN